MTDVKRLLAEATPLPWGDPADIHYGDFGWYVPGCPLGETEDSEQGRADMTLAVHAVNSLPAYEEAVEALERLVGERIEERADDYGRYEESWEPMLSDAEREARAALARLRGDE